MNALLPVEPPEWGGAELRVVGGGGNDGWGRGSLADWPSAEEPRLEEALAAHVSALGRNRLERRRLEAVLDRLGLRGRPPLTLAEAGRVAGLSGERVRQLESRLRKQHVAGAAPPLPQLDAALDAVARALPLPACRVAGLLLDAGLTAGPFSAESLLCAADLLGRPLPFVVSGSGDHAVLLPKVAEAAAAHAPLIEARARRLVERTGASTVEALAVELEDEGIAVSRAQLRVVLETCSRAKVRPDGWFWFVGVGDGGAFVRASYRMLAITSPLSVESLHDGLRRHNAFRRRPAPPPVPVLREVYADHPAFVVAGALVMPARAVDPDVVGPLNRRMVEILRAAPGEMLARAPLLDACHAAGLNLTSVNLYTTYSECLERIAPGIFAARGSGITPPAAPAASTRRAPRRRADERPVCGWTPAGRPWLAGRVTASTWANGVVHVPAELRPALEGRHFACSGADGTPVTTLGVDRHGNSWGWTGFLRRSGTAPGDFVLATFDPETGTAVLERRTEPPEQAQG